MRSKESIITGALLMLVTYTLALSLVSQAFPQASTSATLSSSGTIQIQTTVGIGVYSDAGCTAPLSSMTWGTLDPGATQDVTCYIKNEGSSALTLAMYTSNWYPTTEPNYLSFNWDYGGQSINPDGVVAVTFTLSVSSSIEDITNFSFDITITAST